MPVREKLNKIREVYTLACRKIVSNGLEWCSALLIWIKEY